MTQSTGNTYTPLHNPYIVGNPIKDSKMFFGREEDFAYIKKGLSGSEQGGLIVLCGARRSGKTSVLFQILAGRLGDEFVPVLIDMQSMAIGNDADFLDKLARAVVGAGAVASIPSLEEFSPAQPETPHVAFETFIERVVDKIEGKKLVLTFDEYELIETNIDAGIISDRVLNLLAGLIEHHNVFAVFTGSDHLEERNRDYWSLFLSKARQKRISFLHHRDTIRLITEPLAGEVEYEEGVPEKIAALTAGQPFYTQVLCRSIVDRLNDERKRVVSAGDVQSVVDEVVENPLPQMIFHWNALADIDKLALSIIAELNKTEVKPVSASDITEFARKERIGYEFDAGALNKSLETLFHGDLIIKETTEDKYSFKMGLWRRWVSRMHSVWQVVDELDREGGPTPESGIVRARPAKGRKNVFVLAGLVVVLAVVVALGVSNRWGRGRGGVPAETAVPSATIDVSSTPEGATVLFNGDPAGITPFQLPVAAGSVLVAAVLPDYRRNEQWIAIQEGDSLHLKVALVPRMGHLELSSEPQGADILVDGSATGLVTPAEVELPVTETHDVAFRKAGFLQGTHPGVRVFADTVIVLHHDFSRPRGALHINSTPNGADITIDGERIGQQTPFTRTSIEFGEHRIGMRRDGYADTTVTISLEEPERSIVVPLRQKPPGYVLFQIPGGGTVVVDGVTIAERRDVFLYQIDAGWRVVKVTNRAGRTRVDTVYVGSGVRDTLVFDKFE
jgi:hypothetical protein